MEKKPVKREVINAMLAEDVIKNNDTYVAYLENELALLNKKKNSKSATKNQKENVGLKEEILSVLENSEGMTATEIFKSTENLAATSLPRVTALLTQLKKDGKVVRIMDKKKAVFSLA